MTKSQETKSEWSPVFTESVKQIIAAKEGEKFTEAIGLSTDLYRQAIEAKDFYFAVQALHHEGSVWKILAKHSGEKWYGKRALMLFQQAAELSDAGNLPEEEKAVAKFLVAQAHVAIGNYSDAIPLYEQALESIQTTSRSQANKGDFKKHLGEALCLDGEIDKGLAIMQKALQEIRTFDDPNQFANRVWETGCLLALAKFTNQNNHARALEYAREALEIATREKLTIRQSEAQKMLDELS